MDAFHRDPFCVECGQSLRGTAAVGRCSECGTAALRSARERTRRWAEARRTTRWLALIVLLSQLPAAVLSIDRLLDGIPIRPLQIGGQRAEFLYALGRFVGANAAITALIWVAIAWRIRKAMRPAGADEGRTSMRVVPLAVVASVTALLLLAATFGRMNLIAGQIGAPLSATAFVADLAVSVAAPAALLWCVLRQRVAVAEAIGGKALALEQTAFWTWFGVLLLAAVAQGAVTFGWFESARPIVAVSRVLAGSAGLLGCLLRSLLAIGILRLPSTPAGGADSRRSFTTQDTETTEGAQRGKTRASERGRSKAPHGSDDGRSHFFACCA